MNKYSIKSNTYLSKETSFAEIEIGDIKKRNFYPQVKIKRWNNEVNFSARLVHGEKTPKLLASDNKISWHGNMVEAHFYDVESLENERGYEFEVVLKEKPITNVISMTIQTKGLDFWYQPPLTKEEIEEGCIRPENVVGSYAVYHKTMVGDYTQAGGKNYLTGKAFHIFRPRIEDAVGNWVWGDLNIDEKNRLLTVTIPQNFLNNAVYPIHHAAGLEFGYKSIGASTIGKNPDTCIYAQAAAGGGDPATPASSGNLTSVTAYLNRASAGATFTPALYSNALDLPVDRLAYINTGGTALGADPAWVTTALTYSGLVASTIYWFGVRTTSVGFTYYYDTGGINETGAEENWPDPANIVSSGTRKISVYGTYSASGITAVFGVTTPSAVFGVSSPSAVFGVTP